MRQRVVVVGARGQLGAALTHEFTPSYEMFTFSRQELDASDDRAVAETMARVKPDILLNGAAFTDVDASEDRPVEALNGNAFAVRALARAAEIHGAVLVHYSTDFVFDGTATTPYTELDRPNPRSVYAASKLLGEWFALDAPRAYVLRVESLFGRAPGGGPAKGSVAGILNTLMSGGSPKVFEDRTVSPTYVIDAARATRQLIESAAPTGLYHCVNSGHVTWLGFAQELMRQLGRPELMAKVIPVRMADVTLRAARPQFCALSNDKLRSAGVEMSSWQDAISRYVRDAR